MALSVSIWSDIACPWCLVGKRRFERALQLLGEQGADIDTKIVWRSFELDPRQKDPHDSTPYVERLAKKYSVPVSKAQGMIDNMAQTGKAEGLDFDFSGAIPANTFEAHRLLHWARSTDEKGTTTGAQDRLKEALMMAHFEKGADVGSREGLLAVVDSLELDVDAAAAVLASNDHADDVRNDEQEAQMHGITGVPFFVIGRFGVGGAQRPEALVEVIQRALAEQQEAERESLNAEEALAEGALCTPETC